jgi:hypothetical protein
VAAARGGGLSAHRTYPFLEPLAAVRIRADPKFAADMANRGIDVDYRPGAKLREDLWREYKLHAQKSRIKA